MKLYSAAETQRLLPFPVLLDALERTVLDYAQGRIICPERVVTQAPGSSTLLMAMPCASSDLLVTKLLTICPANAGSERSVIQGQVTCGDAGTGELLFGLDGPTVTMRRTAAISMLSIRIFRREPVRRVLLVGTGAQAVAHCDALATLYPGVTIFIRARSPEKARGFCLRHVTPECDLRPETGEEGPFDAVITVTSSREVIYDAAPHPGTLVIGVGAFRPDMIEVGPKIVQGSSLYVDDPQGAPSEAGDLIQADVDWASVRSLADALKEPPSVDEPVFFKSVGCAAWDLAACRVVVEQEGAG
ncbi:delta(1)-pyrroline-2-carboxylate reductase family protein [Acetobacter estunensis]|uniref:delta(1)-pyrroline-2-carboxylate reductase family protein n=1 Tax=Acetobacter estunensis TaxID=104097 RepID=UPI001C2D302E|nr:delta(1)-pyrroline-2-carboxylate reductase family protein [Acetobacter estunensis]MBV1838495.1 delta(1)-pyrroline-2-carboxylate reductase family protein [Acetobacter estunensis]